jgi:hypothetical protein
MGIFDFFKKKNDGKEKPTIKKSEEKDSNEVDEFTADMIKASEAFVTNSSGRFSGLDFTVQSLKVVDEILEEASDFYEEMMLSDKTLLVHVGHIFSKSQEKTTEVNTFGMINLTNQSL